MYISRELRKKSIAEYVLYMWQVEDMLRAYGCSLSRIRREYISKFGVDDSQKEEMADWYGNLISMMNNEGCREKGHLRINKTVVDELSSLNARLASSDKYPFYKSEYYKVLPFIVELRKKGAPADETEIETCLGALYGTMLLRLQKKEISPETRNAIKEITTFLRLLSDYYMKDKREPLAF